MKAEIKLISLINLVVFCTFFLSCVSPLEQNIEVDILQKDTISTAAIDIPEVNLQTFVGALRTEEYIPLLQAKKVAVVANHTSFIGRNHLVDSLLSLGIEVQIVFSPEHGFRGDKDAGEHVSHSVDSKTGLSIYSLHGKTKKPSSKSLEGVDVVLFDIQDVGVRFYTYISSLHYVMEACAENNVKLIVLDRPNPNAHYVSGPVLQPKYKSFVGLHPVPVVYGMTIGEYARMINGQHWLKDSVVCDLTVVDLLNWDHDKEYILPIPPSPNLPNQLSLYLYPHLCFFEGTAISVGRGTDSPFQLFGHPHYSDTSFSFKPVSKKGASRPPLMNEQCYGKDLRSMTMEEARSIKKLDLSYLFLAHQKVKIKKFFTSPAFLRLLVGNNELISQMRNGLSLSEIENTWEADVANFLLVRKKYLVYP